MLLFRTRCPLPDLLVKIRGFTQAFIQSTWYKARDICSLFVEVSVWDCNSMVEYRPVTAAVAGSNPVNLVIVLRFCFEETNGGYSSVGRALPLQGRCQRFESAYLHI